MYEINDRVSDKIIRMAQEEIDEIDAMIRRLKGPEFAKHRKQLRDKRYQWRMVMAGINTGVGATRGSAR
jgi:hypothetical protein